MSEQWRHSWESVGEYWPLGWKRWRNPLLLGIILFVLWSSVNPSVVPFVLFRIQPFNDPIIGLTFHHNLAALVTAVPKLAISAVVIGGLSVVISRRLKSPLSPSTVSKGFVAAAVLAIFSLGVLAIAGVPIGQGNGNFKLTLSIDGISMLFVLPVFFWWWPWQLSHSKESFGSYLKWLVHAPIEKVFVALAWLIGLAVAEMLAAAVAWTTFSPFLGMVSLAAVAIVDGAVTWKAAAFYAGRSHAKPLSPVPSISVPPVM